MCSHTERDKLCLMRSKRDKSSLNSVQFISKKGFCKLYRAVNCIMYSAQFKVHWTLINWHFYHWIMIYSCYTRSYWASTGVLRVFLNYVQQISLIFVTIFFCIWTVHQYIKITYLGLKWPFFGQIVIIYYILFCAFVKKRQKYKTWQHWKKFTN